MERSAEELGRSLWKHYRLDYLFATDIEIDLIIHPIDFLNRPWKNKDFISWPPVLRIDYKVMDAPIGVFQDEVFDVTDLAVGSVDMIPSHRFDAA